MIKAEKKILKYHYHYVFVRDDGKVLVEMHWAFTRRYWPFQLDPARLWARRATVMCQHFSGQKISLVFKVCS
jgi:hypothetical protein